MLLPLLPFPNIPKNVRVTTSNCSTTSIFLEISSQSERFPTIALKPNSSKNISLPPGQYRFFFAFQNVLGAASIEAQAFTPHANSPFPPAPKVGTAAQGDHGLTVFKVEV